MFLQDGRRAPPRTAHFSDAEGPRSCHPHPQPWWVGTNARKRAVGCVPLSVVHSADLLDSPDGKKRSTQTVCKHDTAGRKLFGVCLRFSLSFSVFCCFRCVQRRDKSRERTATPPSWRMNNAFVRQRPRNYDQSFFIPCKIEAEQERG